MPGEISLGSTLAHYEVTEKIASGGMAEIYKAHDCKLNRKVAVKVLAEKFSGQQDMRAMFRSEARCLALLTHPFVVRIYDIMEAKGDPILILEYVPGYNLWSYARTIKPKPAQIAQVVLDVAEAVESVHDAGYVHQDLKPSNIIVAPNGRSKLIDFGLARPFIVKPQRLHTEFIATEGFQLPGTLGYMSPEQIRQDNLDHRSDIFVLGIILAELVGGRHPFQKFGASVTDSANEILAGEPDLSSAPHPFRPTLTRMLEKNPNRRYPDLYCLRKEVALLLPLLA